MKLLKNLTLKTRISKPKKQQKETYVSKKNNKTSYEDKNKMEKIQ